MPPKRRPGPRPRPPPGGGAAMDPTALETFISERVTAAMAQFISTHPSSGGDNGGSSGGAVETQGHVHTKIL